MILDSIRTRRSTRWALLLLITWLAAFLRWNHLGRESLWDGEIFTLLFAQYDWTKLLPSVSAFSAHPPLWFALTKAAMTWGWNETMLRAPAAFAGILSVPAVYALGKRLFDARVGLIGAFLLAISPINVLFSQNARNYAFFVLLAILLVYGAVRATFTSPGGNSAGGAGSWWALFVLAALAGLYTHYLFILPLAGTVLAMALKLLNDAARQGGGWKHWRRWWRTALVGARPFLLALVVIAALYLPWTPTVGSAFLGRQLQRESGSDADENAAITLQDGPRLLKDFSGDATWGLVLATLLALAGIVWAWRHGKRAALFWFGISLALPIAVMVLLAPRRLPSKYLIYVLPAYLLFVANGIVGVSEILGARVLQSERRASAAAVGMLALLALAILPNMPYWNGTQTIFTGKGWLVVDEWKPWREVAASVAARAAPGDMVLFPEEARALTARSVVPYFDNAFYQKLYSAPPQGRVWWVSEMQDVPAANAARVRHQSDFGPVVVQELEHPAQFQEITLPNAGFEEGFKSWDKAGNAAQWAREEQDMVQGAAAARITLQRANSAALRSTEFPVTPGKLYRVTAYVKDPTLGFYTTSPQLFVNFYQARDTSPKRTRLATLVPTDQPGWFKMVNDGIVPPDAKTARVEFLFRDYAYALGRTSIVDNVQVWLEE